MSFTRSKNSKRLQFRGSGGRFASPPSLGAEVCKKCRGLYMPFVHERSPSGFAVRTRVTTCPHCNEPV